MRTIGHIHARHEANEQARAKMIEARDAYYDGVNKGNPLHWRDVGPDEIWQAAWDAALMSRSGHVHQA